MPIKIPDQLPARQILVREGVSVMDEQTALRQDIRPLQIGLLNLMPNKIKTETQFARLLGASPLQVELTLVRIGGHKAKNTPEEHLISFYHTWDEVAARKFDGFIITGAPIELLPFEEVSYWEELTRILDWTTTNVHSSFFICWGAMAAAWHFHRIPKHTLEKKAFGVFRHRNNLPASPFLAGFSDDFAIPVSRWTEVRAADFDSSAGRPELLVESDETGPCLAADGGQPALHVQPHRIRFHLAEGGIRSRRCRRHAHRGSPRLLSGQRSVAAAAQSLALARASVVRQLDQPSLPDDHI